MQRLRPWCELGEDLCRADEALHGKDHRGVGEELAHVGRTPLLAANDPERRGQDERDDRGRVAVHDHRRREFGDWREEGATHQWPIRVEQASIGARHIRAEEEQRVDAPRGNDRCHDAPARAADTGEGLSVATPGEHPNLEPNECHRRGEVCSDRDARVGLKDRLAAQPGLEEDEGEQGDRGPLQRSTTFEVAQREEHQRQGDQADHRRDRAVDPLQPRLIGDHVS